MRPVIVALVCVTALGCADNRSDSTAARPPATIRASLDRTATWVGDPVTYTLEIVCAPGYAIVEDDLGRDRLPLEGLEVRGLETAREPRDGGAILYRARFQLASFTPDRERLRIGPVSIRYYRREADGRVMTQVPVGTVDVPAEDVALQSTLPESAGSLLRVARTPARIPPFARAISPLGLVLIALSLVTVALGFTGTVRRRRVSTPDEAPVRRPATDYRKALDEIRQLDATANGDALHQAFGRLDHLLREFLTERDIPARSLTPDEIEARVVTGSGAAVPRTVAQVLRACERARYAGPSQPPSRELLTRALGDAEQALASQGGNVQ
jgi:hypothetical protein